MAGQRAGWELGLRLAGSLRILVAVLVAGCAAEAGDPDAASRSDAATRSPGVEIEYIAHASFLLRAEDGTERRWHFFSSSTEARDRPATTLRRW